MIRSRLLGCCLLAGLCAPNALAAEGATIIIDLPVDCTVGQDCFIQQYFDHDPGPGAKDYRCGTMTYDGHDGIDIRLPTVAAQKRGVEVLAAAPGIVKGMRDGMPDADVRIAGSRSVSGHECGNGVVIAHQGGWETQYCHMARGSVRVRIGQQVEAGAILGLIGESGEAAFPHLHFAVRHLGRKIDPFAWNAPPGTCGSGASLWSARARTALPYQAPQIINWGFAGAAVTMEDVESGRAGALRPDRRSAAIVAFVRAIGLARGDVQAISIRAPDGSSFVEQRSPPLDHDKAQWLMMVGKKRTGSAWMPGRYTTRYTVERDRHLVIDRNFAMEVQ